MDIREYLENNRIVADGGMGTLYERLTDHRGEMSEQGNITSPQLIEQIHRDYIKAGAQLIRTNTFAVNSQFFSADEIPEILKSAWQHAQNAVDMVTSACDDESNKYIWIAADMGPIREDEQRNAAAVKAEYVALSQTFLSLGADIFVFETLSEFDYIMDAIEMIKAKNEKALIIVQFSINRNGYTSSGMRAEVLLEQAAEIKAVDAVGFNCGVGPLHLYEILKNLSFPSGKYLTALPNAGYPTELRGHVVYSENVPYYVSMVEKIAELGFDVLGGCCGTTPAHIEGISDCIRKGIKPPKKLMPNLAVHAAGESKASTMTDFMHKLEQGKKVFAVELDPPFDANDEKLMTGAATLKKLGVDLVTLADSPLARPRADAVAAAAKIQYTVGMPVMPHISCRDKNLIAHRAQLIGMQMNDIRHALIVTGDPVARGDRESIKSVFNFNSIQLMQYLKNMNADILGERPIYYGGALNYNQGLTGKIAERMQKKIEAGAAWFLTQPVYSREDIEKLGELKQLSGGRILAGIMPLVSRKNALFIKNEMPGIHVPETILARYEEGMSREAYEDVAVAISLDLMKRLENVCDGYYFMTPFNRVSLIARIIKESGMLTSNASEGNR